jgi:hypothetical protein
MPVYKLGVNYDGENKVDGIGILRLNQQDTDLNYIPKFTGNIGDNLEMYNDDQQPEPFFPIPDYLSVFIIKVEES